jgi:hypothetical protein
LTPWQVHQGRLEFLLSRVEDGLAGSRSGTATRTGFRRSPRRSRGNIDGAAGQAGLARAPWARRKPCSRVGRTMRAEYDLVDPRASSHIRWRARCSWLGTLVYGRGTNIGISAGYFGIRRQALADCRPYTNESVANSRAILYLAADLPKPPRQPLSGSVPSCPKSLSLPLSMPPRHSRRVALCSAAVESSRTTLPRTAKRLSSIPYANGPWALTWTPALETFD